MLTKGLTGNFLLRLLYSGCTSNQRHSPFISPSAAGSRASGDLSGLSESFQILTGMRKDQETVDQESS
jgi:hypothetical protein